MAVSVNVFFGFRAEAPACVARPNAFSSERGGAPDANGAISIEDAL
jgi:hypothetical protein